MGMLIVNDDEFDSEAAVAKNQKTIDNVIRRPFHGRKPGDNNVPEVVRKMVIDDNDLGKELGISQSSISAYSNGATSTKTYHQPVASLKEHVDERDVRIAKVAKGKLLKALRAITDEKVKDAKLGEIAGAARNLAQVAGLNTDKGEGVVQNNIVFYAPTPVKSDNMPIIEVSSSSRR